MENSNSSNENDFVDFFKGLDESYQRYLISEIQKKTIRHKTRKCAGRYCQTGW